MPGFVVTGLLKKEQGKFYSIDVPGADSTVALGINDAGGMVGDSLSHPESSTDSWLSAVPIQGANDGVSTLR